MRGAMTVRMAVMVMVRVNMPETRDRAAAQLHYGVSQDFAGRQQHQARDCRAYEHVRPGCVEKPNGAGGH